MRLAIVDLSSIHSHQQGRHAQARPGNRRTQQGLGREPALEGGEARLQRRRRGATARQREDRAHAGEARCGEALEDVQGAPVRELARRAHRQPGHAAGEGRRARDLSLGLAGGGRCQRFALHVPRPVAVRDDLGAHGGEAHQQRARAPGPDPDHGRQGRHRLVRADRGGRRVRLRRRAERLRADEGDDRCRRRRRAFRRPARLA